MRRRVVLVLSALVALALSWLWMNPANATLAIQSITTSTEYDVVTITFATGVEGSGTGDVEGGIVASDVEVLDDGVAVTPETITHTKGGATLVLAFARPIQPGTAVTVTVQGDPPVPFETEVPLAASDWPALENSLRAIALPVADVPIAPYLATSPDRPRTLDDLLPELMESSIDLPDSFDVVRNADGSFTVETDGTTTLKRVPIAPTVELGAFDGTTYSIDLTSATPVDLDVALGGTIELDKDRQVVDARLTVELDATTPSPSSDLEASVLTGGIGIAAATVEWDFDLDVSIAFDHIPPSEKVPSGDVPRVHDASVRLGTVTLPDLGPRGEDITVISGGDADTLLTITWPSLPTTAAGTGETSDSGWAKGDLLQLANVSINDLIGAPGGIASWMGAAQTLGDLDAPLPVVGGTLGGSIGMAESLAAAHGQVAAALAVSSGDLAVPGTPTPRLSPDLCLQLKDSAVRAAKVAAVIPGLDDPAIDNEEEAAPTSAEILAALPSANIDEGKVAAAFEAACDGLFGRVELDLGAGTIEAAVDVPAGTFTLYGDEAPVVDLSDDDDLKGLAVALKRGIWSGSAAPDVAFTLGLKLESASELVGHGLAVDLDVPDPVPPSDEDEDVVPPTDPLPDTTLDEDDVTAAYRVYVPADEVLGSSAVTISGTGLKGFGQLGFLDLAVEDGAVTVEPSVTLRATDPDTGITGDGKADLLELLAAAVVDANGNSAIADVLEVTSVGDDVDASFVLRNEALDVDATLVVAGDVAEAPLPVTHTFGDALAVASLDASEVVTVLADGLDAVADGDAVAAGDERIPVIDVSLDEIAGLSTALTDSATTFRDHAPATVTELISALDDALGAGGLGSTTVDLTAGNGEGDEHADPQLTFAVDADRSGEGAFPLSFELDDGAGGSFPVAPTDGGSTLDASVAIDFSPSLGLRLDGASLAAGAFVSDLAPTYTFSLTGDAEGSVTIGPADASVSGEVDLTDLAFTATTTDAGDPAVPLTVVADRNSQDTKTTAATKMDEELTLSVPTEDNSINGTIVIVGAVPGDVTYSSDDTLALQLTALFGKMRPNLQTLANGAIETSRFIARGSKEVAGLTGQLPVVGADVGAQFDTASAILDQVAEQIQVAVDTVEENEPAAFLQEKIDALLDDVGCNPDAEDEPSDPLAFVLTCAAHVRYTVPEGQEPTDSIMTAEGIEVLLTVNGEVGASTSASASFGLDPVLDLDVDLTDVEAKIGFTASIGLGVDIHDGFYLFPGIDPDTTDDVGTLFELYAGLDVTTDMELSILGLSAKAEAATIAVAGGLALDEAGEGTAGGLKLEMPERLLISELVKRTRKMSDVLVPSLDAHLEADIEVEVALEVVPGEPFRLILPLIMDWEIADTLRPDIGEATVDIVEAELDVAALARFLSGVVTEFNSEYNPLGIDPVAAALDEVVPLIDVSVRTTLVTACKLAATGSPAAANGCTAFEALANLGAVAAELDALGKGEKLLALGSFQIYPAPEDGKRYSAPGSSVETSGTRDDERIVAAAAPAAPSTGETGAVTLKDKVTKLTGGYMSLPILEPANFPAVMGVVLGGELGEDLDVVRFEITEDKPIVLGRSFAIKRTLLALDTAFIDGHLSVNLSGGVGLNVSGGFGFSTRAISTGNPTDGIFLVDNGGLEVSLGASVSAEVNGRFSVLSGLAEVNFRGAGSFSAVGGIDLFDESPVLVGAGGGDGRLFFDEIATIADSYFPPLEGLPSELCMFQLRTTGKWSLAFAGSAKLLGFTIFDESFSDSGTLWDETLSCKLRPRIARVEDGALILHAGPHADDRFDNEGDVAEAFTITTVGGDAVVAWAGSGTKPSVTFPVSSFDSIVADMGRANDSVTISDSILQPVQGRGGPGNDTIGGGGGDDDLDGGDGADTITGGAGDDVLRGGLGADALDGGDGGDEIDGEAGDDTVRFAASFGNDEVTDSGDVTDVDAVDFTEVTQALTGDTSFGDATVATEDAEAAYPAADFERVRGGAGDDTFQVKDQEPDGFVVDGFEGSDAVTFLAGRRNRQVGVTDSGTSDTDIDSTTVLGGSAPDEFLLRAASDALDETATSGFVARISGDFADRYDYDSSIEDLTVDGGVGDDEFTLDDNATATHVVGGPGDDVVQVGQIFGEATCVPNGPAEGSCTDPEQVDSERGAASNVGDPFATTVITRGHLSNGVSNELVIDGDEGADRITVFANHAPVQANGGDGNDEFVARAFIITASLQLNGAGGIDDFSYVLNDKLTIDGGGGTDTFTVVGTEANDGFIIGSEDGLPTIRVCKLDEATGRPDPDGECAIDAKVNRVEMFAVLGLEGNDVFWVQDSAAASLVTLSGGEHSDRFLVGAGMLDGIAGPVVVAGDDAGEIPSIPAPVVLPGEDDTRSFDPLVTGGTDVGDTLEIDATDATAKLEGEVTAAAIRGFDMADGPFEAGTGDDAMPSAEEVLAYRQLEFIQIDLGEGDDDVDVLETHVGSDECSAHGCPLKLATGGGHDDVDVTSIAGETWLDLGAGDDVATLGRAKEAGGTLDDIGAHLKVVGGADDDNLDLDDTADGKTRVDIGVGTITEAGLDPAGVSHDTVESVHVRLGDEDDTVNVRGTATDADLTEVHGNGGDDRFAVSSAARFAVGQTTDHLGGTVDDVHTDLLLHGGSGGHNVLQVSDRAASAGDGAGADEAPVSYDGATLTGLAAGALGHDVTDETGAFGGGITFWTSELRDVIAVVGADLSTVDGVRTLTTLNAGGGGDSVGAAVDTRHGDLVINTEEGDDTVNAGLSARDLIIFGGLGADSITGGGGNDTILGDVGRISTSDGDGDGGIVAGGGGPGDRTDGGTVPIDRVALHLSDVAGDWIRSGGTTSTLALSDETGGPDTIAGGEGDDLLLGQQGPDRVSGDDGDDTIEGNAGDDVIDGGAGQDDLLGGGSAIDGVLDGDRTWTSTALGLADGNDTTEGGAGADVVLGDNGWIVQPRDAAGAVRLGDRTRVRDARVSNAAELDGTYGADRLSGGDGPDELHGQRDTTRTTPGGNVIDGDELDGGAGDDVLIGDLGKVVTVFEDGRSARTIQDSSPFLGAILRSKDSRTRKVTLFLQQDAGQAVRGDGTDLEQTGAEGDDVLLGGPGSDVIHGGAGDDVASGGDGTDVIFGGDGDDAAWGGPGIDELFGGHHNDSLDVIPRDFSTKAKPSALGPDPRIWFEVAGDTGPALAGKDIMYGGWDTDDMQADEKSNGPTPGDRLIDWAGAYNRYLSCSSGSGAGSFLRVQSPSLRTFLVDLATGRGAVDAGTAGSSGHRELGLVTTGNTGSVGGLDHVAC